MWSFGCVLYELIKYTIRNVDSEEEDFEKERYLFQGTSCFPLSPMKDENGEQTTIIGLED